MQTSLTGSQSAITPSFWYLRTSRQSVCINAIYGCFDICFLSVAGCAGVLSSIMVEAIFTFI